MDKKIKFETVRPLIDEAFEKGESFSFEPNGVSMLPFIKGGKTTVTIEKYKGGAQKYDIVFYTREDGKYVMHRIVKIYPDAFGVCGDNQWWVEKVNDEQIFAIVTKVDGKKSMGSFLYLRTLWLRRFIIHVKKYIMKHSGGKRK
ncbi:MAG: S24/S26 family peptidase [Clostridia bacterium]|nr:S24/S26 family peptidase [Clostridia bacterium]